MIFSVNLQTARFPLFPPYLIFNVAHFLYRHGLIFYFFWNKFTEDVVLWAKSIIYARKCVSLKNKSLIYSVEPL